MPSPPLLISRNSPLVIVFIWAIATLKVNVETNVCFEITIDVCNIYFFICYYCFCAISPCNNGHLFDAGTLRSTRYISYISASNQVIIQCNIKQTVTPQKVRKISFIVRPSKTVTVRISLISIKDRKASGCAACSWRILHVVIADICIISGVCIKATIFIWLRTVTIAIISLTVLNKAAHDSTKLTVFKVYQVIRKFYSFVLYNQVINFLDSVTGIKSEPVLGNTIFIQGFTFFIVICASIKYLLIKHISLFRNTFPWKITFSACIDHNIFDF